MSKKKAKKEKVIYIDDGRSIADMSGVQGSKWSGKGTSSSPKDIWHTYISAVKMMIRPMFVTVGFLIAAFLIITFIFWLM